MGNDSCNDTKLREGLFHVDIQRLLGELGELLLYQFDLVVWVSTRQKVVSSYAFIASRAQSWVLQDHTSYVTVAYVVWIYDDYVFALACLRDTIPSCDFSSFTNKDIVPFKAQQMANVLFSEMVKDMEVHFDMTMRQKAVVECLRAPHA
ncbi:hypothetical protein Tco_0434306 [Tanacetum coccineum]